MQPPKLLTLKPGDTVPADLFTEPDHPCADEISAERVKELLGAVKGAKLNGPFSTTRQPYVSVYYITRRVPTGGTSTDPTFSCCAFQGPLSESTLRSAIALMMRESPSLEVKQDQSPPSA